jgi:hypothetical protein
VLLYIFTLEIYSGFNGMRQAIAVGFCFLAYYYYLEENQYIPYAIVMALAFGFHATALFAVPFHFLSRLKLESVTLRTTVGALIVSFLALWNIWSYLISFLDFIGQTKLANDYANVATDGSGYTRMFVYLLPVVIAIWKKDLLREKYGEEVDGEIILLLFSAIFMLFSTKYWLFARVASYFAISTILFVPKLECIFSKESKKLGNMMILALYFCYMVALLLHGEGGYYPYSFID